MYQTLNIIFGVVIGSPHYLSLVISIYIDVWFILNLLHTLLENIIARLSYRINTT